MKVNPQLRQELIEYIRRRSSNNTKPQVTVFSAYELGDEDLLNLKKRISLLDRADIKVVVDPSLLAGIVIQYGSKMIDLSLKSELLKLEHKLYETA